MKYYKKILALVFIMIICVSSLSPTFVYAVPEDNSNWPAYPEIVAEAAVLIDASTGCVIYDKNCHQKMYPARITKILTTLLAIENGNLNDMVHYYHYDDNTIIKFNK